MKWIKHRVVILKQPPLSEMEMEAALAGLGEGDPVWVSLMQLLEASKAECMSAAATSVSAGNNDSALGQVCAWDNFDIFQRDLIERRDKGLVAK